MESGGLSTILVALAAVLAAASGFAAAWVMRGGAWRRLREQAARERGAWREAYEELRAEGDEFLARAETSERDCEAAMARIVALEAEIAGVKQARADLLAAIEADVAAAKRGYEARIAGLEARLASIDDEPTPPPRPDEARRAGGERPDGLGAPLGHADDLTKISGVGPKLERRLNDLGIFHYRQIAGLSRENVAWMDRFLKFKGRIERDDWIGQARALAGKAPADAGGLGGESAGAGPKT